MRRVKYSLCIMHWAQDEICCSHTAPPTGISDSKEYNPLLGIALDDTIRKAAYPVKFKDKCTCPEWEVIFDNYLSTIPGVNGLPLSYVVWDQVAPERTKDSQGNFIAKTIACAPLIITHFQSDTRKVHQLLNNYLVTETAEQWIRGTKKRVNGRDDFYDLLRHYSGEGNVRCRVATVDHLRETLHYKSDRALSFNMFLDRMQKIINIFRNGEEIMADSTQVRELFRRVQ